MTLEVDMNSLIVSIIISLAPQYNIDPVVAISVAKVESSLNPNAIGLLKEVGLFQVRPEYSKYTSEQLKDPKTNIKEGLRILSEAKKRCKHQVNKKYIICFNRGIAGGSKVKDPANDKYYLKVFKKMNQIKADNLLLVSN